MNSDKLFRLYRKAQREGLTIRDHGDLFLVSSHSRPGHEYTVDLNQLTCTCEARGECKHISLALSTDPAIWHKWQNRISDELLELRLKIYRGELSSRQLARLSRVAGRVRVENPVIEEAVF